MTPDLMIDRLAGTLTPVHPRRPSRELALLGLLALGEVVGMFALGMGRHDLDRGMAIMEVWKIAGPACVAIVATLVAVNSGDPSRTRVGIGSIALIAALALVAGGCLTIFTSDTARQLLDPVTGLSCVLVASVLACPPALALGYILHHAAPARPRQAALAAALAAGAFGATLLGLHCPDDGVVHSLVWHPLGIMLPALAAILPMARAAEW